MLENKQRTEIGELGEFGLIEHLTKSFEIRQESTSKAIGDDAAVIDTNGETVVVSTDLLIEGIHFDLSYMPLKHLGYKSVVVNLSDICAMNAVPSQITVSIALSNRFSLEAVEEIYQGIMVACKNYKVDLVGGDTSSSRQGLFISVTAVGHADKNELVYRNTAKDGELLCVTGDLGAAYMGYQLLEREKRIFMENSQVQPDLEGHDYIIERQLKPEARTDLKRILKELDVHATSMIDISDGLASEVFHLCTQSGVGMSVYEDKIPIDPTTYNMAREMDLDPTMCALSGGEDYEILFTVPQSDFEKLKNNSDISIIGHCTDKNSGINLITKSGNGYPV